MYLVEIFKQVEGRRGGAAQRYTADKVAYLRIGAHTLKLVYELLFLLRGQEFVDRDRVHHKPYLVECEALVDKAVQRRIVRTVYPANIVAGCTQSVNVPPYRKRRNIGQICGLGKVILYILAGRAVFFVGIAAEVVIYVNYSFVFH